MPIQIKRLEDKPILVVTLREQVDQQSLQRVFSQTALLSRELGGPVYRIMDARDSDVGFVELMGVIEDIRRDPTGSAVDPNVREVYVGGTKWVKFATRALQLEQYGGVNTPIFHSLDDALMYVHIKIADDLDHYAQV
jgi:hypothetical protein